MSSASYSHFFARCSGGPALYPYQERAAGQLHEGHHLELWAPTGAGKTLAVLVPFLWQIECGGPRRWDRLIYVLPLRSLVQSIAAEARRLVEERLGWPTVTVTVQTGEQPDDQFFDRGDVVVTTYDQLLSGALESPYGLPDKLHNINAAAVAGALVVFDEYHLMQTDLAFLTAVAHLQLYRPLCQSVWMTATATAPLRNELSRALDVTRVEVSEDEFQMLPAVADVRRHVVLEAEPLTAEDVLRRHASRSIALVNTVARADALYQDLCRRAPDAPLMLLHARFLPADRGEIERRVRQTFARGSRDHGILVCTQVIEAGMDLSCEALHTEAAPMNALAQRAGRCARFPGDVGQVSVYRLPTDTPQPWLPYAAEDITAALAVLAPLSGQEIGPALLNRLVADAHGEADARRLRVGYHGRQKELLHRTRQIAVRREPAIVSDLIRADDGETIRVILARDPGELNPYAVEGFGLGRWGLAKLLDGSDHVVAWRWTPAEEVEWTPLRQASELAAAFAVCLSPDVASYSREMGLRLGEPGTFESPPRARPHRREGRPLKREAWAHHAREVGRHATVLVEHAGLALLDGFRAEPWQLTTSQLVAAARTAGLIHDVGKLQVGWQGWAERAQRSLDPAYVHITLLAHTDFDPTNPLDRERERNLNQDGRRPPHAAASAVYAARAAVTLLRAADAPPPSLLAACLASVLGHHGGGLEQQRAGADLGLQPLVPEATAALCDAADHLGWSDGTGAGLHLVPPVSSRPARPTLHALIEPAIGDDAWPDWWPFTAWLTRVLRRADQRATSEYGGEE